MSQLEPAKGISKEEFLEKAGRFRILIIGRANAGKTSILQKVCNATEGEKPEIYDPNGRRINLHVIGPSLKRGEHDINNEMIFRSNPGFIFHDSRGFEAGSVGEFRGVQEFIQGHANETSLRKRLHVIWYCIPAGDARLVNRAEEDFFAECDTKGVPVLVLFTKFDSLDSKAFSTILRENPSMNPKDATHQAPVRAKADFDRVQANLSIFQSKYPPKAYLYLYDMHKPNTACYDLLDQTAAVLDNVVLQALFLSTQKSFLALRTKYAMMAITKLPTSTAVKKMLKLILLMSYKYAADFNYAADFEFNDFNAAELNWFNTPSLSFLINQINDKLSSLSVFANSHHNAFCICVALAIILQEFSTFNDTDPEFELLEPIIIAYLGSTQMTSVSHAVQALDLTKITRSPEPKPRCWLFRKLHKKKVEKEIEKAKLLADAQQNTWPPKLGDQLDQIVQQNLLS